LIPKGLRSHVLTSGCFHAFRMMDGRYDIDVDEPQYSRGLDLAEIGMLWRFLSEVEIAESLRIEGKDPRQHV